MKKIVNLKPTISATRFEAVQPMQSPMHRNVQKIKSKIRQRHSLPGSTKPIQAHSAMSQSSQKPLVNSTELKAWVKRLIQEKEVSPPVDLDALTQHRNNFTLRGKHPITFMDGTRAFVHPSTSHRAIDRHSNLREPHDQETYEQMLHASLSSFRSAVGV